MNMHSFSFEDFPENDRDFFVFAAKAQLNPVGAVAALLVALRFFAAGDKVLLPMFEEILAPNLFNSINGDKIFSSSLRSLMRVQIGDHPEILRAYFTGAEPGNNYLPMTPYKIIANEGPYSKDEENALKLFVETKGADSSRPVTVKKGEDGLWRVSEFSSLLLSVKKMK